MGDPGEENVNDHDRSDRPDRPAGAALTRLDELRPASAPGVTVVEMALGQPSLDEVFLALTGRPADDQTAGTGETGETEEDAA
jgi:hypothetical protein